MPLANSQKLTTALQIVLFHQMSETAAANVQQLGWTSLDSVGLRQRILQQRALDVGDIFLHIDSIGQNSSHRNTAANSSRGGSHFCAFDRQFRAQFFSGFERDSPLDGVFELANIAGPIVSTERIQRIRVYSQNILPCRWRVLLQKMVHEKRNVFAAFAQWWHADGNYA